MRTPQENLVEIALSYVGVREVGGDNLGPEVERFQRAVDGVASGEPWCMCFVQYCVKETGVPNGLFASESVLQTWERTPRSMRRSTPAPGLIVLWRFGETRAGHCGIVVSVGFTTMETVEGNTGPGAGIIREGDGVYRKIRQRETPSDARMRLLGFIDPFSI